MVHRRGHWLIAAAYDRVMSPAEHDWLGEHRVRLAAHAWGRVLDVGAGTGANLPLLRVADRLVAVEPDPAMRRRLVAKVRGEPGRPEIVDAVAEALPFADASFDVVVFTLVLCSVTDVDRSLAEAHRVLTPDGRLLLLEHVRGHGRQGRWQDRVTPLWSRVVAGCHPNRDIGGAVDRAGFRSDHAETFDPMPRWIPTSPMLEIVARQ